MKPKNNKERQLSFFRFLGLFLLTVAAIMVAVFFTFKVPSKENKLLREKALVIEKEMNFQNDFYNEMKGIKNLIDSLERVEPSRLNYLTTIINNKIVDLQKIIPTRDSSYRYDYYMDITYLYLELLEGKDRLRSLYDTESLIDELKTEYEKCKDNLKLAERELRFK